MLCYRRLCLIAELVVWLAGCLPFIVWLDWCVAGGVGLRLLWLFVVVVVVNSVVASAAHFTLSGVPICDFCVTLLKIVVWWLLFGDLGWLWGCLVMVVVCVACGLCTFSGFGCSGRCL